MADEARFSRHVVVAQEGNGAEAGREILRRGGNAIDAAVASALALAVTLPEAGNLGGGGFIVAYLADRREVVTVDFREIAPQSAGPRMYLGQDGELLPKHRGGAWAAGVPGTVRGLGLAHQRWGKLPWAELVRPAIRLAREGFSISADLAGSLNHQLSREPTSRRGPGDIRLADFPESLAVFSRADGMAWKAGDRLVQPDLAATLERLEKSGPDEFYAGRTAELIVRYMESHGGRISRGDLAGYRAKVRDPIHTRFRGREVYSIGPPSSGGVVLCQALNILERYDLKAEGREAPRTIHLVTEAMRRAFFTRATRLGDPDFGDVPAAKLASKEAADALAKTIGEKATPSASLASFPIQGLETDHTTHLSAVDANGNAVALTYTLEEGYGAKAAVEGAGFLLNNEMGDFNLIPGRTDVSGRIGTEANLIAPKKRMLSSQTPTIVLEGGKVRMVTGSPGGRTIPNTVLWVVLNLLEFELPPGRVVDAARTHHQWFPDILYLERRGWPDVSSESLRRMGHICRTLEHQGNANTIILEPAGGSIHGIPDPRRETTRAAGD